MDDDKYVIEVLLVTDDKIKLVGWVSNNGMTTQPIKAEQFKDFKEAIANLRELETTEFLRFETEKYDYNRMDNETKRF